MNSVLVKKKTKQRSLKHSYEERVMKKAKNLHVIFELAV